MDVSIRRTGTGNATVHGPVTVQLRKRSVSQGPCSTIRVSLTPRPGGDRREEVHAACELLQALGLRSFSPSVTACPGCGRTTSETFPMSVLPTTR